MDLGTTTTPNLFHLFLCTDENGNPRRLSSTLASDNFYLKILLNIKTQQMIFMPLLTQQPCCVNKPGSDVTDSDVQ